MLLGNCYFSPINRLYILIILPSGRIIKYNRRLKGEKVYNMKKSMKKSPFHLSSSFREIQIVNGQVVKNVELDKQVSPEKEVIQGNINGNPVFMEHDLKRKGHKRRSRKGRKRSVKRKTAKK